MKKNLLFLLFFFSLNFQAQLDREHWFPPMSDASGVRSSRYQSIYLSTNETIPFKVKIHLNNVVIDSLMVSKGSPVKYVIKNREDIITTESSKLFTPVSMGYYLKGEKGFFATLRFSTYNHGEIVTSKGTAGLGTEFRAIMAPLSAKNVIFNFTVGMMATEDNTIIKVNEFDPGIVFADGVTRSEFNISLQKGQSYIIQGVGDDLNSYTGFIGSKISSTKPIVIVNGNFNGQYASTAANSSDILMDQSVPIDKLGQEFVLMKGNGDLLSGMETAIIVATEDNTNIYMNGSSTPIRTINAGEHFRTPSTNYQLQGSGHYNMHIKTDKNVYVYQLLAGNNGGSMIATGGFNYIPPLSCYLPKRIDEIGLIDENEYSSNNIWYTRTVPTKLNIITERGAIVNVYSNNSPVPISSSNGPFNVTGNPNWVTYSISDITGNISVISTRAVTAGISAGDDAVGYGGYFAGFSYIPAIFKSAGECLPDVILEVTEGFSTYQWLSKTPSGYIAAPGVSTNYQYKPTQAGIYAVKLKEGSCAEIQTADYKFFNCDSYTSYSFDTCSSVEVSPEFILSSQNINFSSLALVSPPTKGNVSFTPDGKVLYTANADASGTDTFRFSFCGIGLIPDCETVQLTINIKQVVAKDVVLTVCSSTGTGVFDLGVAAVTSDVGIAKKFYKDAALTEEISVSELSNYSSASGFVYVRMENSFSCFKTSKIEMKIQAPAVLSTYTKVHCDEEVDSSVDGIFHANTNEITEAVLHNNSEFILRYYRNVSDANAGNSNTILDAFPFQENEVIWLRIEAEFCAPQIIKIPLLTGTKFVVQPIVTFQLCDNDLNNTESTDISMLQSLFTSDSYDGVYIFDDLIKAQQGSPLFVINSMQTIDSNKVFYYRFKKVGYCDAIGTLNLSLKQPKTSSTLKDKEICEENSTTLDAGPGFSSYLWSTGEKTSSISGAKIGEYWVDLTSNGCTYRQFVSITKLADPEIDRIEIKGSTVVIHAMGGNQPYYYSLDDGPYQNSNVFNNVKGGNHIISLQSADRCNPIKAQFNVIELYNAISPNGDGINDVLNFSGLVLKEEPTLEIFDRFGKIVFKGESSNSFIWNGKLGGQQLPTGTYWYITRWREPKAEFITEYTGWILLKNRN